MVIAGKNYRYICISLVCLFALLLKITPLHAESAAAGEGILIIDRSLDNAIIKLSIDAKETLFRIKGLIPATDVEIDPRDGTIWAIYKVDSSLVKYSADGRENMLEIKKSFCTPRHSTLDIDDNAVWIASWTQGELIKYSMRQGEQLLRIQGLGNIYEVVRSPFDGSIWIGDQKINKFIRFSNDGKLLGFTQRRFGMPLNLAINKKDGSLWASFHDIPAKVVKFASDGKFILVREEFNSPEYLTIDQQDGSVWVTDAREGELIHISSSGEILKRVSGFKNCGGLSEVDSEERTFWMANTGEGEIIKFSGTGEILVRVKVGGSPQAVLVYKKSR